MAEQEYSFDTAREFIGQEIGVSRWLTVGQARIDAFAEATDDRYWIHTDPARATDGPFGTTIAHGFLSLSLLAPLMYDIGGQPNGGVLGINYGLDRVRFLAPVPEGARVRARMVLEDVEDRGEGRYVFRITATVELEGSEKPALVADWLNMYVKQ